MILPVKEEAKSLKDSRLYKLVSKMFHVTHEIHGAHFFIKKADIIILRRCFLL